MFGHGHRPGSKRASEGYSWAPSTTMQKLALIASPLCRQYDPKAKARIGPLSWGGVLVPFAFPPRSPPQPRSPIGLNSMPDCAPILGNLKRKCIIFFIHVCSEPKFTGWGRHQTDPTHACLYTCMSVHVPGYTHECLGEGPGSEELGGTGDNRHRGHTPKIQTHHPPT